jgi:hypothetical protein
MAALGLAEEGNFFYPFDARFHKTPRWLVLMGTLAPTPVLS